MQENIITTLEYSSPCGEMILGEYDGKLCLCDWVHGLKTESTLNKLKRVLKAEFKEGTTETISMAAMELDGFFAGSRTGFDIPLLFIGTDFQKTVWNELTRIPYGTTVSYGELAVRIGHPTAVRAVANSNARNPISIFAPCHRVIGSDHSLTGYGGGLPAKQFLLELEKNHVK